MKKSEMLSKHIGKLRLTRIIIFAVFLFIAIGSLVYANYGVKNDPSSAKNMFDIAEEADSTENLNVYLNAASEAYRLTSDSSNSKGDYYLIYDADNYMYIAFLDNDTVRELRTLSDSDGEKTIKICGKTKKIDSSIVNKIVEKYKSWWEDTEITTSNFHAYSGYTYIDVTAKNNDIWNIVSIVCFISAGISLLLIVYNELAISSANKKFTPEEWEKIASELDDNIDPLNLRKVYFTKNYIVNLKRGIDIIKYNDIIWMHFYELRQNGVLTQKELYLWTRDKKNHPISTYTGFKATNIDQNLVDFLLEKNDKILFGFKKETKTKANEIFKEYKQNKKSKNI